MEDIHFSLFQSYQFQNHPVLSSKRVLTEYHVGSSGSRGAKRRDGFFQIPGQLV